MSLELDRSKWQRVKFGDVVNQGKEKTDPEADGIERYVAGEHMDTDSLAIARYGLVGDGYLGPAFIRRFRKGQVLYGSRRTYLRKVALADFDGVCANTTFVMESSDPNRLLPELLPLVMSTESFHAHSIAESRGSVNPYVNWPDIAKYEFDLPPLDQQKRIANLLWATERDFGSVKLVNDAATRFRIASANETFLAWASTHPSQTIEALFEVQLGKMLSAKTRPTETNSYSYLANVNVRWNAFNLSDLRQVALTDSDLVKYLLEPGDVLVCEGGEIGRSAIWRGEIHPCHYQKALHRLRRRPGSAVFGEILVEFMQWSALSGRLASFAGGTTFSHLTEVTLRSIPMPVPSMDEQKQFLERLKAIDDMILAFGNREKALRQLKTRILAEVGGS